MFDHPFWTYSGIIVWTLILAWLIVRFIFGKTWMLKFGINFLMGSNLLDALRQFTKEVKEKEIKPETLTAVAVHIFWRLTRVGIIGLIIAILPVWLLWQQNSLLRSQNELFSLQDTLIMHQNVMLDSQVTMFSHQNLRIDQQTSLLEKQTDLFSRQNDLITDQNRKIDFQTGLLREQNQLSGIQNERLSLQNNLLEADRRSSLVFLMSNILDNVDEEVSEKRKYLIDSLGTVPLHAKYELSDPLIGRIIALSKAFRPYRFMDGDTLSYCPMSPERGQLFIALMRSNLDSISQNKILTQCDFSFAVIGSIDLQNTNLVKANLKKADLNNANLSGANLSYANLNGANLNNSNLSGANLRFTNLSFSHLRKANLRKAILATDYYIGLLVDPIDAIFNDSAFQLGNPNNETDDEFRPNVFGRFYRELGEGISQPWTGLCGADLRSADLRDADLRGINIRRADLRGAELDNADLRGASVIGTDFSYAHFNGARLIVKEEKNLSIIVLELAKSYYSCHGFDQQIRELLEVKNACLFTKKGCKD